MSDISHPRCGGCGEPEYACRCPELVKILRYEINRMMNHFAACRTENTIEFLDNSCRRLNAAGAALGGGDTFTVDDRGGRIVRNCGEKKETE